MELDPDQKNAIEAIEHAFYNSSCVVIRAGAGSGKTETAIRALKHLLQKNKHENIMVISHTNITVDTFTNRLNGDMSSITTIHKVANKYINKDETNPSAVEEYVDFEKMLDSFIVYLENCETLCETLTSVKLIMIDEFQDTGEKQMKIVRLLRQRLNCGLATIGDPAQAIYSFQGGDVYHMIDLLSEKNTQDKPLRYNYRSNHIIVQHANLLGTSYRKIEGKIDMITTRIRCSDSESSYPLQLRCFSKPEKLIKASIEWIVHKRSIGILQNGDVLQFIHNGDKSYFEDYCGRKFDCIHFNNVKHGSKIKLINIKGAFDEIIDLNIQSNPKVDSIIQNKRPTILVTCFNRNGNRAEPFVEIKNRLQAEDHESLNDLFFTCEENKELSSSERQQCLKKHFCKLTVHGAKGGEWDSVLFIDLGEKPNPQKDNHPDQIENHNKLYVGHTRARDDLWHFVAQYPYTKRSSPAAMSRFMTAEVCSRFNKIPEEWENEENYVEPMFFTFPESSNLNDKFAEKISVTMVSRETSCRDKFHICKDKETVFSRGKLCSLPIHLRHKFNILHGIMLEWLMLWELHKDVTRRDLDIFLTCINCRYHVNYDFATIMLLLWENSDDKTKESINNKFHDIRLFDPNSHEYDVLIIDFYNDIIENMKNINCSNVPQLKINKIREGFTNIRRQSHVNINTQIFQTCPVRRTIKHFDHGESTWHLSNIKNHRYLKEYFIDCCRNVRTKLGNASLYDKFYCMLFMQCVKLCCVFEDIKGQDEVHWGNLLDVVTEKNGEVQEYFIFLRQILPTLRDDAKLIRKITGVDTYQTPVQQNIHITTPDDDKYVYEMCGFADATGNNSVLEVTSRENNCKQKIQQNFIYSACLNYDVMFNYYVESRKLVKRVRNVETNVFLYDIFREYIHVKGLPNNHEPLYKEEVDNLKLLLF